ncbi:hypothetical protein C8A01DRAFT_51453 [Parachaetomium inaequale]|uniref:Uncharacterized protein n=1 Tax=Parachaetomium inaequale TaxID=2588326 RepID=A0AAN6SKY6_9PEZI|nr:hypothetical protein C8A01DRAFT_51453 [Parachaetomium inaequale]
MASQRSSTESSDAFIIDAEKESLVFRHGDPGSRRREKRRWTSSRAHLVFLYASNVLLLVFCSTLVWRLSCKPFRDPTTGVYSPANEAIEYIKEFKFRPALFEKSAYMGFPTDETDRLWKDLYSYELYQTFGISKITEQEARKLIHPTLAIPGTKDYLVQLDVWHELHCLAAVTDNRGVIDRESIEFRHWDHCVDSIREAIMYYADVAPIPFHVNFPANHVIDYKVTPEQADEIIRTSGFDNAPWEDIQDQYIAFPGNTYFKYWRDHPEEVEAARKKLEAAKQASEP